MAIDFKIRDYQVPTCLRIERGRKPGDGVITGELRLIQFRDQDSLILYAPELNLSAYGDTEAESIEMFKVVFQEFGDVLLNLSKKEMDRELSKYGFYPQKFKKKNFSYNGPYIDDKGILKQFNLPEDTNVETKELTVA